MPHQPERLYYCWVDGAERQDQKALNKKFAAKGRWWLLQLSLCLLEIINVRSCHSPPAASLIFTTQSSKSISTELFHILYVVCDFQRGLMTIVGKEK